MAANYAPHYLLKLGGLMGPERWSIGLRLSIPGASQPEARAKVCDAMTEVVEGHARTFMTALRPYMIPAVTWDFLSCNHIGNDGRYTLDESFERYVTPVAGTGSTSTWCGPDVAIVATLTTARQRGYASKGRVYLPLQAALSLTASGSDFGDIQGLVRSTVGTATAGFLSELNDLQTDLATNDPTIAGAEPIVGVFSPGTGKKQDMTQEGHWERVTGVRIGAQPDTQRRRVNKQPDLWDTNSTTYGVTG